MTTETKSCPDCGADMGLKRGRGNVPFWACGDHPRCTRAVPYDQRDAAGRNYTLARRIDDDDEDSDEEEAPAWDHAQVIDEDSDEEESLEDPQERVAEAYQVLKHPLVAKSNAAQKLSALLDAGEHERVLPLVLGETAPSGKPTVEAILRAKQKQQRPRKPRRKVPPKDEVAINPLEGIDLYTSAEAPLGPSLYSETVTGLSPTTTSAAYPHHALRHERLNPLQSAALKHATSNCNLVIAGPTSVGKTLIAEMPMGDAIARGGKAIFLSPLRAVSQEKYDDWTHPEHAWSDLGVSILTGDYSLTEARKKELKRADVIVMTSEMLDSKTRRMANEGNHWLLQTLCIVVDEAHLLTMADRGDALEAGLMRFTRQNPHARVVLLSATMPNVGELGSWLTKLNGKATRVLNSEWRPTKLTVHWPTYPARGNAYHWNEDSKRREAIGWLRRYPEDKWIVFVHSKKAGNQLLTELRRAGESVSFHSADLDSKTRRELERDFKEGDLRIVIATSTLAYGINMPARRVLVLGINRGIEEVDPIDVKQMVGRAGRTEWGAEGDAYVLLPQENQRPYKTDQLRKRFQQIGMIRSCMNDPDVLAFHLTAEVAEGEVSTLHEAVSWHERSLAAHQGQPIKEDGAVTSAGQIMERLESVGIFKRRGMSYQATMLGRVSSWLYYSPFDVADWHKNFRRLIDLDRLRDDDGLAWALGSIKTSYQDSWLPREVEGDMQELEWRLQGKGIKATRLSPLVLAFGYILEGHEPKPMISMIRGVKHDAGRVVQAISMIDRYVLKRLGGTYTRLLETRLQYGCNWTEAELCRLPGVGAKRARDLIDEGVRTIRDVLENKASVVSVMGRRRAIPVLRMAREILGQSRESRGD